jgi:dTDP-4-amino-4,6-dideoxygalactose transaminase
MTIPFVDLPAQYAQIAENVESDILHILRTCQYVGGRFLERFERALGNYLEVKHVVGVSNGTDAIMLACEALGIGKGDKVIVPNNSFIASAYGVTRSGAAPILVDVDPDTYLIDLEATEAALKKKNSRIKAIMVVDLYGQMPNMEAFQELAQKYKVYLIEDAAQAVGATYQKKGVGSYSDVATTSFYPAKNLGTIGQGGAIITNNSIIASNAKVIANQGSDQKYHHICLGGNYRLDTIMAAQLYHALQKLDEWNNCRRSIAKIYNESFTSAQRPTQQPNGRHIYHLYEFKCRDIEQRNELSFRLDKEMIRHGLHYPTLISECPPYTEVETPVASNLKNRLISLPMFPTLTDQQARQVVWTVQNVCLEA